MSNTWLSWSSGKDSAYALYELRKSMEVSHLFTTVTSEFERVSMHSTRVALLQRQADAVGLPLEIVSIPSPCTNDEYEKRMNQLITLARKEGVTNMAFGDLFLQDIREYRERMLRPTGINPLFPLWERSTDVLAREMIDSGFKAVLTCVDPRKLPKTFAGRYFDKALLRDLPEGVDPCGENGEFHTFVFDAPIFKAPIPIQPGEIVERDGFVFADFSLKTVLHLMMGRAKSDQIF